MSIQAQLCQFKHLARSLHPARFLSEEVLLLDSLKNNLHNPSNIYFYELIRLHKSFTLVERLKILMAPKPKGKAKAKGQEQREQEQVAKQQQDGKPEPPSEETLALCNAWQRCSMYAGTRRQSHC